MNADDLTSRAGAEGLWDWSLDSNRVHFSPRWMALLGCEAHDVGNTPDAWFQRIHPEDRQEVTRAIEAHLADGSTEFDIPHRMLHADGSCRWMSCHGVVQRNADGTPLRVMGFHKDATAA